MIRSGWRLAVVLAAVSWCAIASAAESVTELSGMVAIENIIEARPGTDVIMDLHACVAEALHANDQLGAERLRRTELDGQMKQALATGLPTLDIAGDWTRSRNPAFALDSTFGGDGGGGFASVPGADPWFDDWLTGFGSFIPAAADITPQTFWTTTANLNWTINPLRIIGAVGAAKLAIEQQNLNVTSLEYATTDQILTAYYAIIKDAERINAVQAELKNQSELVEVMKLRYTTGMATRLDTLQAAVTLANVRPRLELARARLRNEGSRLNALMGRPPQVPLSIANELIIERDPIRDEVAIEMAMRRPDLTATALFVDILRRNRQAQIADNRPYLTVNGSYGYVGNTANTIFENGQDSWRASVALTIPIFDGLDTRGRVAETDGRIRRTERELSGKERQVQVEVLEIIANLRMARQVLDVVTLNLLRSEEVLDESVLMLKLGKVKYVDVLVSESNRAQAHSNLIDARYEVLVLTSALKRAVGFSPLVALVAVPNLTGESNR